MTLTPEIEAKGLKAYEQVCAFERLRSWRLPVSFVVCAVVPAVTGVWMWALGHLILAGLNLAIGVFLACPKSFRAPPPHLPAEIGKSRSC